MVQTNFRNRNSLFLCRFVCILYVCGSFLLCVAAESTQKEDDGCERICYYRNQKFVSCLFLERQSSNQQTEKHTCRSYLDPVLLILKHNTFHSIEIISPGEKVFLKCLYNQSTFCSDGKLELNMYCTSCQELLVIEGHQSLSCDHHAFFRATLEETLFGYLHTAS